MNIFNKFNTGLAFFIFGLYTIVLFVLNIESFSEYISNPKLYEALTILKDIVGILVREISDPLINAYGKDITASIVSTIIVLTNIFSISYIIYFFHFSNKYKRNNKKIEEYRTKILRLNKIANDLLQETKSKRKTNKVLEEKQKEFNIYKTFYNTITNQYAGDIIKFFIAIKPDFSDSIPDENDSAENNKKDADQDTSKESNENSIESRLNEFQDNNLDDLGLKNNPFQDESLELELGIGNDPWEQDRFDSLERELDDIDAQLEVSYNKS